LVEAVGGLIRVNVSHFAAVRGVGLVPFHGISAPVDARSAVLPEAHRGNVEQRQRIGLKATEIGYSLLLSPLFGFFAAALLLLVLKLVVRNPALYREPKGNQPPPWWIRGTLIATCTGVSFAHGSNDGQKGMGLIMLILIGTVPTAYALNRALPASQM